MYDSSRDSSSAHLKRTLYHFHFCCGLGGGARGFNRARPVVGNVEAQWECLGGVDVDPAGLRDFERLAGVPGTLLDLFTREQYTRFHGQQPPAGWTEATAEDIRRAAQNLRPDAVFISSPCKGASGLLSEATSKTPKYQALNERGIQPQAKPATGALDQGLGVPTSCRLAAGDHTSPARYREKGFGEQWNQKPT